MAIGISVGRDYQAAATPRFGSAPNPAVMIRDVGDFLMFLNPLLSSYPCPCLEPKLS
jgi:hypothetical protein